MVETSETGVSIFARPLAALVDLASEIGVILPTEFVAEFPGELTGIVSLLGGLPDFSLAERSRPPTLLLTFDAGLPLKYTCQ
ncbi:hypothetical protein U1Q18_000879 [Sarracenia purpurea var. burkii]